MLAPTPRQQPVAPDAPPPPLVQFDAVAEGVDVIDALDGVTWSRLDQLSRAVRAPEAGLHDTLMAILHGAVDLLDGVVGAGINLYVRGTFTPQATWGDAPPVLDDLQQRTGTGPCIDASREQRTIAVPDTTTDQRWPQFAAQAAALGVHSMLCLPLWIDDRRLGSLSLYGSTPHAFTATATSIAGLFATHAALALGDAQRTENLRRALVNRDVIGQAKGILMVTRGLTADDAFAALTMASQRLNRKVVDIATDVTTTGMLPT